MSDLDEQYFQLARNAEFEKVVREATEKVVLGMDKVVANEVRLRYVTHIFARTLDEMSKILFKPTYKN